MLISENNLATERAQKSDDDKKYVPISSRGRNIRPPMNFWTGKKCLHSYLKTHKIKKHYFPFTKKR